MLIDNKTPEELEKIAFATIELAILAERANEITGSDKAESYNLKVNEETIRILGDKNRLVTYISKFYPSDITNGDAIKYYIKDLKEAQETLIDWALNGGLEECL